MRSISIRLVHWLPVPDCADLRVVGDWSSTRGFRLNMFHRTKTIVLLAIPALLLACQGGEKNGSPRSSLPSPTRVVTDVREPTAVQKFRTNEGRAAIEGGDHATAIRIFEELLDENPSLTVAYIGIGLAYEDLGEFERAEPAFERATRLDPRNYEAQLGFGEVLQVLGKLRDAIRAYQQALAIDPESVDALVGMSSAFLGLDMASNAIAPAERAVVLAPDDGRARADLGEAYMRVERIEDAIDSFEIALELLGNEPAVIRSLVECYAREDRFAEAINAGQVLISIEPTAQAWERLGRAYFRHGDYDASVESYRRAVEIDPEFWPALNGIGVNELNAWLRSGRKEIQAKEAAGAAFRSSLRVYPDQPKVVQLLTTYPL